MFGFNCWNWYLAMCGYTTIEFWSPGPDNEALEEIDYAFQTVSDNLFRVFGTHKVFRILSPSLRNVPFTGIEWAFFQNAEGFDFNGFKVVKDVEMATISSLAPAD